MMSERPYSDSILDAIPMGWTLTQTILHCFRCSIYPLCRSTYMENKMFSFSVIHQHCCGSVVWNPSTWKTMTHICYNELRGFWWPDDERSHSISSHGFHYLSNSFHIRHQRDWNFVEKSILLQLMINGCEFNMRCNSFVLANSELTEPIIIAYMQCIITFRKYQWLVGIVFGVHWFFTK